MAGLDWADDEWELVNDDGFVYKRKKRPRLDPPTTSSSSHPPLPDPTAEEGNRRERKRTALVKLKQKYQREIRQWEHLSNTLKAMQEKASIQQQTHPELPTPSSDHAASTSAPPGNSSRQLIDELLSQAEIQEAIICDISNLCDVAEALCSAQEERLKKSFIDLPIWAKSPRELITSLCEE
nr:uncharacterized protein LOC109178031 [Ipomoea trifida]